MLNGYAGTSDSGFRTEVESEQALARGEHLMDMIDTDEHSQLSGLSAAGTHRRLTEFGTYTRFHAKSSPSDDALSEYCADTTRRSTLAAT